MTIADIVDAARAIIRLRNDYASPPSREMTLDFPLYAYLEGRFGKMSRQLSVTAAGATKRIDYRSGGHNPVVIEFAVRPPQGGGHLYGSQNQSELAKLTRVPQTKARTRVLLLLDLSRYLIAEEQLKPTYDSLNAGRGRFARKSVRVVYVNEEASYDFLWWPHV